jgi:hypothetical protein
MVDNAFILAQGGHSNIGISIANGDKQRPFFATLSLYFTDSHA